MRLILASCAVISLWYDAFSFISRRTLDVLMVNLLGGTMIGVCIVRWNERCESHKQESLYSRAREDLGFATVLNATIPNRENTRLITTAATATTILPQVKDRIVGFRNTLNLCKLHHTLVLHKSV